MIRFIICIIIIVLLLIYTLPYSIFCFFIKDKDTIYNKNIAVVKQVFKMILFVAGVKTKIYGKENLDIFDKEKSVFIISNHRGFFDIITGYLLIKGKCSIVAKDFLKSVPVLGMWMKKIHCQFLDRQNLRSGAMMVVNSINYINTGVSVWIFPEGTRNKNSDKTSINEFKQGAFKIPEKTNCYILPMAILNSDDVFEKQAPILKPTVVYIKVGKAFKIDELNEEQKNSVSKYSENCMKELLIELKSESLK